MDAICDDLAAEHADLDRIVAALADAEWDTPTPSPGWAVRDQISHLWYFDQRAVMALTDTDAFAADAQRLMSSGGTDLSVVPGRAVSPAALLASWRADRDGLLTLARTVDPKSRVPWYGPAMAARSFITARLMETWAHGQDIVDAVGASRTPTDRLRHVAHIGVRARPFSYMINERVVPDDEVYVGLDAPSGELWEWNSSATNRVTGPALDFCLAVTQRRHLADTALVVEGPAAAEWMSFAQAFAGAPGGGREIGQFAT
ncbi:MAG: TIGR03084 family metal-binding protein [Ilumatobacteraceae bacterium]